MKIATPLLGPTTPTLPECLCLVSIRSHWGSSSSHFTFLSLCAAAGLLGFLFLWASDITGGLWIAAELCSLSSFSLNSPSLHPSPEVFFSSWEELSFSSRPMSRKRSINYLEQGLVWVITHVMLATLSEVLCLFCSTTPHSIFRSPLMLCLVFPQSDEISC